MPPSHTLASGRCSRPGLELLQLSRKRTLRYLDVVSDLGVKPVAVGLAEEPAQTKVGIRRSGALATDNVTNAGRRDTELLGPSIPG